MAEIQYQNLEPNRGIYKGMRFPVAPWAEYPKWVDTIDSEGKPTRVVVTSAAEERTLKLSAAAHGEMTEGDEASVVIRERNELAGKVSELSQALVEAKALPEQMMQEMAEMRKQMAEMSRQLLAAKVTKPDERPKGQATAPAADKQAAPST